MPDDHGVDREARARLEAEAAGIIGRARAEATAVARDAVHEAADVRLAAERYASDLRKAADADRDSARRTLVQAQERALMLRADAEQRAEAIVARAVQRARAEAAAITGRGAARGRMGRAGIELDLRDPDRVALDLTAPLETPVIRPLSHAGSPRRRPQPVVRSADTDFDLAIVEAVNRAVERVLDPGVVRAGRRHPTPRRLRAV